MANLVPKSGGKAPEKSNFSQTCSLLSQYLKGGGGLGDISLGISGKLEASKGPEASRTPAITLDLLPNMENSSKTTSRQNVASSSNTKSIDFFPQFAGSGSPSSIEDITNKVDLRKYSGEPRTAQMTIFYGGEVIVFDDFPADKAKEIMELASKGIPSNASGGFAMDKININKPAPELTNAAAQERPQFHREANDSDLRIAPRTSLRRFFERRKERVASKAPYQMNSPSRVPPPSPKSQEGNPTIWVDAEGQTSKQFDLNL